MKRLLRPFGYVGCLLIGAAVIWFAGDKIKSQVPTSMGGTKA
jgi:hypothetical protein